MATGKRSADQELLQERASGARTESDAIAIRYGRGCGEYGQCRSCVWGARGGQEVVVVRCQLVEHRFNHPPVSQQRYGYDWVNAGAVNSARIAGSA